MSDESQAATDTVTELIKVRDALYETIDALRQQLAAVQRQLSDMDTIARHLNEQLAARDAEVARLTDCIIEAELALEAAGRREGERLATGIAALADEIARLRSVIEGLQREAAVAARDKT